MEARTNVYEAMFIFDSNRFARERAAMPTEVEKAIKAAGGEVVVSRLWEERRLAYPIAGQRKGTYWLSYFRLDSNHLTTVNRDCHLNETIVRSLVLKIDPRIVDTLVSHALAGPAELAAKAKQRAEAAAAAAPKLPAVEAIEIPEELGN